MKFLRIDIPYPLQWGVPIDKVGDAYTRMIASFVAFVESSGVFLDQQDMEAAALHQRHLLSLAGVLPGW